MSNRAAYALVAALCLLALAVGFLGCAMRANTAQGARLEHAIHQAVRALDGQPLLP